VRRVPRFQLAASSRAVIFAQVYCSLFFPACFLVRGRSAVPVSVRRLSSSFVGSSRSGGCRYVPYHSVCGSRFGEDCCMWLSFSDRIKDSRFLGSHRTLVMGSQSCLQGIR
jgi:hypothetical protein